MKHIDLFSGIGGFAYAIDQIFNETKNTHIFVEIDPFCQAVLRKHWPDATITGDIRAFKNPEIQRLEGGSDGNEREQAESERLLPAGSNIDVLTGGFPCQPFSQAGARKGTGDDRYLWPEMFRIIRDWKPTWVIAENVRGLTTWNDGLVLETVCSDLEREGYDVQTFMVPALAVGAPHRRDRVWFIAHHNKRPGGSGAVAKPAQSSHVQPRPDDPDTGHASDAGDARLERGIEEKGTRHAGFGDRDGENEASHVRAADSADNRRKRGHETKRRHKQNIEEREALRDKSAGEAGWPDWETEWPEVAAALCRMDDGLPGGLDQPASDERERRRSKADVEAIRKARLHALGNAIVPQVAMEIMRAIKQTT